MLVDLNGELVADEEARVSPFDAGYLYGDGIFDTLRSYRGFLYQLDQHLERLRREAELLQIPVEIDDAEWRSRLELLLTANDLMESDARLRIQISRGGGPRTDFIAAEPEELPPVSFVFARPVGEEIDRWQRDGIRVMTVQSTFARGNFPQIKSLNYLPSIMAQRFARAQGFDEAVLLNRQSKVLEGATSNIFLLRGDTLLTPTSRLGLLAGITRDRVLDLARGLDLKVEETASELRDLLIADEVFLTGSVKEIVPVVGIDAARVSDGRPGPTTLRLLEAYRTDVEAARAAAGA